MMRCSKQALEQIKKCHMKPRPRWQFIALHALMWTLFVLTILLGSVAFSIVIRLLDQTYFSTLQKIGHGSLPTLLLVIPYIWLGLLAVVLFLAHHVFCKTKTGYRHGPVKVVLVSVLFSVLLGTGLNAIGTSRVVERQLADHVPPYAHWQRMRDQALVKPENGLLVGRIIDIAPGQQMMVIDFKNMQWTVYIDDTLYMDSFVPEIDARAVMLGEVLGDQLFRADRMMNWRPRRKK